MDKEFNRKKRLTSVIIVTYMFLTGAEYAIIFPSAWAYLQSLGVTDEYMYGFVIAAYSLSMGVAGVLGGRLADIYMHQTKSVVLISIAVMALGNFQYAIGINVWNILLSRLLCGVGTAAQSAMTAEICRVTEIEERTPILAVCNAAKQVGLFIAPAIQILFSHCHIRISEKFEINPLNAPGWFMGATWILFCIATMTMFYNLTTEMQKVQNAALKEAQIRRQKKAQKRHDTDRTLVPGEDNTGGSSTVSSTSDYGTVVPDEGFEGSGERRVEFAGAHRASWPAIDGSLNDSLRECLLRRKSFGGATLGLYVQEFLTDTFVLLQSMVFTLYFCVIGLETVIPMIMQEYFGCGVYEVSLIYMGAGIAALLVYSSVAFLSRHIRDSTLQILGWTLFTSAHIWLIVVVPLSEQGHPINVAFFTIGCMLVFLGYPIASIGNNGLCSKVLSEKTQGMGQGMRRLLGSLGLILGPLWGGSTVKHPYWLIGVPFVVLLLNGLMLMGSFVQLRKVEDDMARVWKINKTPVANNGERKPLISQNNRDNGV